MQATKIRWSGVSWNPAHGCSKISDGCKHCYAAALSLKRGWTTQAWTVPNEADNVLLKPHKLSEPYGLKQGARVFVNSMSDLFHRAIPDWYRAAVFCVMLDTPQHTYQVLTKRSAATIDWHTRFAAARATAEFRALADSLRHPRVKAALQMNWQSPWGSNIWQGVSVEDSRVLDRIRDLQRCPAQTRFISAEPLLGAWGADVDLTGIHWLIVGGESGEHMTASTRETNVRWMDMTWAREIRDLCVAQGVAFFFKQDSGFTTEMRPWLVESDGSRWMWEQYPQDFVPAVNVDTGERRVWRKPYAAYAQPLPDYDLPWAEYTAENPPAAAQPVLTLCTGRIDCGDPDALDITVKSASTPEGRLLAPTWQLVMGIKQGGWSEADYTEAYLALLRGRYAAEPDAFRQLLARERLVLTCYCPAGQFCHRHLALEVLVRIASAAGIRVVQGGEIGRNTQPAVQPAVQQLALF